MRRFSGSDRPTWRDRARIARAADAVTAPWQGAIYEYDCDLHLTERRFPLGTAPETITCDECGAPARKTVSRLNFTTVPGAHNSTYPKP